MTKARQSPKDAYFAVARHTTAGQPLFCPDGLMFAVFAFCLAVCCRFHNIQLLAATLLPDQERLVVYCPGGNLPAFTQRLHRLVAVATKVLRRWVGPVWDHRKTEWTRLETAQAVAESIAETMAMPVAEGYVTKIEDWPGICSLPDCIGTQWILARLPPVYFNPTRWLPVVPLHLHCPRLRNTKSVAQYRKLIWRELKVQLKLARQRAKQLDRVPRSRQELENGPVFRPTPQKELPEKAPPFRVGRRHTGLIPAARLAMRRFQRAYRMALSSWRCGKRDVEFPYGTYKMRRLHAVNVAAPR